jgi:transposase
MIEIEIKVQDKMQPRSVLQNKRSCIKDIIRLNNDNYSIRKIAEKLDLTYAYVYNVLRLEKNRNIKNKNRKVKGN